ncbi:MAG: hypothetical protein ACI8PT_001271 [Gammaproteobacteria bacterium]|jgi:hypothetical protein
MRAVWMRFFPMIDNPYTILRRKWRMFTVRTANTAIAFRLSRFGKPGRNDVSDSPAARNDVRSW